MTLKKFELGEDPNHPATQGRPTLRNSQPATSLPHSENDELADDYEFNRLLLFAKSKLNSKLSVLL